MPTFRSSQEAVEHLPLEKLAAVDQLLDARRALGKNPPGSHGEMPHLGAADIVGRREPHVGPMGEDRAVGTILQHAVDVGLAGLMDGVPLVPLTDAPSVQYDVDDRPTEGIR